MEVTSIGMPATRHPVSPARLTLLRLAQRGVNLCETMPSRGARLIVHLCRSIVASIYECESAELRVDLLTRENLRLRSRVSELENKTRDTAEMASPGEWDHTPTRVGPETQRLALSEFNRVMGD